MAESRQVISDNYPYLNIRFEIRGYYCEALALIDTGFTGELVAPQVLLSQNLGLPEAHSDWELADGTLVEAPMYLGNLEITGFPSESAAVIFLGDEYIVARGILDLYEITLDHGKRVIVKP